MEKDDQIDKRSDEELVELTLKNQENFLFLMKRYEGKLLSYILRISNVHYEEAEDVLQDVFIKVYKNLNDFDQSLKFSSWIYRITHNEVISNFRKRKARGYEDAVQLDETNINKLFSSLDVAKEMDAQILKQNISRVLNEMDIKYREILILKFLEEKDYKEISDIFQMPMGTVASLINRAKKNFKAELKKQNIKLH